MGSSFFWGGLFVWFLVTWLIFSKAKLTIPESKDALNYAIKPNFQSQDKLERNLFIIQVYAIIWIVAGFISFFINELIEIEKYETIFILFFGLSPLWITLFSTNKVESKELLWGSPQIDLAKRGQFIERHRGLASFSPVLVLIGFLIARLTNSITWDIIGFFLMYFGALLFIYGLVGTWWYRNVSLPEFKGVKAIGWKFIQISILIVCVALVFSGFMYGLLALAHGTFRI